MTYFLKHFSSLLVCLEVFRHLLKDDATELTFTQRRIKLNIQDFRFLSRCNCRLRCVGYWDSG